MLHVILLPTGENVSSGLSWQAPKVKAVVPPRYYTSRSDIYV
jgi:hypothetical protein